MSQRRFARPSLIPVATAELGTGPDSDGPERPSGLVLRHRAPEVAFMRGPRISVAA